MTGGARLAHLEPGSRNVKESLVRGRFLGREEGGTIGKEDNLLDFTG